MEEIVAAFQNAFNKEIIRKAETNVLSRFGMTMADFRASGLANFGPEIFTRLVYEIEQISVDLTFLVFGFENENGHIFTVGGRGDVEYYDVSGFWAIGSGQTSALGTLFSLRAPVVYHELPSALYLLAKAKFNSETALGVGKETTGIVLKSNGERYLIHSQEMSTLKTAWESLRGPDVPPDKSPFVAVLKESAKKSKKLLNKITKRSAKQSASEKSESMQ